MARIVLLLLRRRFRCAAWGASAIHEKVAARYCGEELRVRQVMSNKQHPDDGRSSGWSGRFSEPVDELVKLYTASVDFDRRLAQADIEASRAHARMLGATKVLSPEDVAAIERGLS